MKKEYIASYENGKGECWDVVILASNYKAANVDARHLQREYGKLWSLRLKR